MRHQGIYNRLRRIEGTIRGIEAMVRDDRADQDILIQLEAAKSALSSASSALIQSVLKTNKDGRIELTTDQARLILHLLK